MYFYTYKITNLINGKIYIGIHKTKNINDGYMGSGVYLNRSKLKYGIENFKKEILMYHESESDMFEVEALIVDQDFVDRKDTYNLNLGGLGGWNHVNRTGKNLYGYNGKPETIEKLKKTYSEINHQQGENNSQFGKMWIYSLEDRKSTRINNNEPIPIGWKKGRKMFKN